MTISLLSLSSCSSSFFDLYPTDQMTAENYMNNVSEVETVLYAAYGAMRGSFANNIVYIGDLPTDNAYDYKLNNSSAHISMHESNVDSKNSEIAGLWEACYRIINRCCLVIESMDRLEGVSSSDYNSLVGQAKFLRAYVYYMMVRVWGDVPLVLEDIPNYMDVFNYGRSPKEEVYTQILKDLTDAEKMLPSFWTGSDKGKASATAAQAIIADVYLTRGDYKNAQTYYEKIIAKEGADLGLIDGDSYQSIFDSNNVNNKEIIFSVQYAHNQTPSLSNYLGSASLGNIQGQMIDPLKVGSQIYGVNILMMTHELEAKFVPEDKRRSVIYMDCVSPDYGCVIPQTLKYFDYQNVHDGKSGTPDSGCHTIVSRYADVILKYAECLNENGSTALAIKQLERIRTRAGLETNVAVDKEAVRKAIADERQLELCLEGHRWFDLVRTGKAMDVMNVFYKRTNAPDLHPTILQYQYGDNTSISEHELIFPIPYAQVELNPEKLKQNPQY